MVIEASPAREFPSFMPECVGELACNGHYVHNRSTAYQKTSATAHAISIRIATLHMPGCERRGFGVIISGISVSFGCCVWLFQTLPFGDFNECKPMISVIQCLFYAIDLTQCIEFQAQNIA